MGSWAGRRAPIRQTVGMLPPGICCPNLPRAEKEVNMVQHTDETEDLKAELVDGFSPAIPENARTPVRHGRPSAARCLVTWRDISHWGILFSIGEPWIDCEQLKVAM